jgi:S1-C subfamily serine protease
METVILRVDNGSPAEKAGVKPGEILLSINDNPIRDVLDYQYYAYDARLTLKLSGKEGAELLVKLRKQEGQPLGLVF